MTEPPDREDLLDRGAFTLRARRVAARLPLPALEQLVQEREAAKWPVAIGTSGAAL